MTELDTIIRFVPGEPVARARKRALAAARQAFVEGKIGAECYQALDTVKYVVCKDGVHRLVKGPDGRTLSDRRV